MAASTAWWPELAGAGENFQVMGMLVTWVMVGISQVISQVISVRTFYILFSEVCWVSVCLRKLFK